MTRNKSRRHMITIIGPSDTASGKAAVRHGLVPERDFDAIGYGNTPWAETFGIASMDSTSEKIAEKVAEALDKRENVKMKVVPELMTHYREH